MKKIFFFTATALLTMTSCKKEATTTARSSEEQQRLSSSAAKPENAAVPINWDTTWYQPAGVSIFDSCTQEYINFTGSIHIHIRGVINDNKITWEGHYDVQNVKGVGEISGTRYVTTESFNWQYTDNFNNELYETNMKWFLRYISLGKTSNFKLENTVRFTVNANGDVTASFDTGGDIIECQK